ncbi:NAD-dependent epimerase/dehydratase family protein [Saccharopolyspora sp. 5N102]|uniref:NAD-dependent epimerase/dehydratase family protein n=1 Tax=Saccharopolyspora sp. 5N102 TaxID=3375155 RepID=UPI00379803A2
MSLQTSGRARWTAGAVPPVRVLLTGATGFLGGWVAEGLNALGDRVTTFTGRELADPSAETTRALRRAVAEVDVVCHLAAATPHQPGPPDGDAYALGNTDTTRLLLDAATATSRCRVVLASTALITGFRGTTTGSARAAYADSKLRAEQLVERYSSHAGSGVSLRFNSLGGPRMQPNRGIIAAALRAAHEGRPLPVHGSGSSSRDYLHVLDAARAVIAAAHGATGGHQVIEIGSGQLTTVDDIISAVERVTRRRVLRQYLSLRGGIDERPTCDLRQAREALGWTPLRSQLTTIVSDQWAESQTPGTFDARPSWDVEVLRPAVLTAPHRDRRPS